MLRCDVCVANSTATRPLTYNAALNKPSYQSSVWADSRGRFLASLANDGLYETIGVKDNIPRCVVTNSERNPWWAVDLGHPTTVYRVDFTNRLGSIN